jgi:hypothetical protein
LNASLARLVAVVLVISTAQPHGPPRIFLRDIEMWPLPTTLSTTGSEAGTPQHNAPRRAGLLQRPAGAGASGTMRPI